MTFRFFGSLEGLEPQYYRTLSNKFPFSESGKRSKARPFQKIFYKLICLNLLVSHKAEVPRNSGFFYCLENHLLLKGGRYNGQLQTVRQLLWSAEPVDENRRRNEYPRNWGQTEPWWRGYFYVLGNLLKLSQAVCYRCYSSWVVYGDRLMIIGCHWIDYSFCTLIRTSPQKRLQSISEDLQFIFNIQFKKVSVDCGMLKNAEYCIIILINKRGDIY